MSQMIVGLTGGIGSGKTTVSDQFQQMGISVVDADIIARQLISAGSQCLAAIREQFGQSILHPDGNLNRKQLRQIIFNDSSAKHWLDNLMHPAIRTKMRQQLSQASSPYAILAAPLLFENQLDKWVDLTLVVDIPESLQISRTAARDQVTTTQVKAIISSQMDRDERLKRADYIFDNEQPWPQAQQQIAPLHQKFIDFSKKKT